ncbi:MAG TPA: hypothetical protein VG537_08640, partial [Candidatus Kapabacteria bacterium]|nr:hypothetical protein [Candidatus Kapabacteria bacterium]
MAVIVHVAGPEFLDEENQKVFARIEETIRQYSTHTREAMHLIRRPLASKYDHFVLLWTRGAALIGLFPFGGTIMYTAHFPRMHPSDFRVKSLDGVADDWPVDYWT